MNLIYIAISVLFFCFAMLCLRDMLKAGTEGEYSLADVCKKRMIKSILYSGAIAIISTFINNIYATQPTYVIVCALSMCVGLAFNIHFYIRDYRAQVM